MKNFPVLILIVVITLIPFMLKAQTKENKNMALSAKEKSLVTISALTAAGNLQKLKIELNNALDAGWTVNQVKEIIVHVYAYAGFPRSIRGLQTFMEVVEERKAKGIDDVIGAEASATNDDGAKYERGKAILEQLTGIKESENKTGYAAFAPVIEKFLKEHLFADIFERDILSFKERELVTISVLSSVEGLEPMLRSHLNICLNIGVSANQLQQFVKVIDTTIGKKQSRVAEQALLEVLNKNSTTKTVQASTAIDADLIFPKGEKITNNNFTGTVYLYSLIDSDSINQNNVGSVTFEPGARSNWHIHPAGQILLVIDGVGYYQEQGQSKKILRKGDAVKCSPNTPHWHGGSADSVFVQLAVTGREKGPTVWLNEVTDEEYHR